ncbi:MAG: hypothetical protein MK116_10795 [Phycisphaerales bacterium]|nr:hypothetical protein [Phycisphaerales bacterium]
MEFINVDEANELLAQHGIERQAPDEDHAYLRMVADSTSQRHLAVPEGDVEPLPGAEVIEISSDRMPEVIDHILHKLHHNQLILFPVGRWRSIFDVVAFSLAENEEWQRVDAAATVELNSRDPLFCDTGDLHLVCDLVKTLFHDSESPDQGLLLITAGLPLVMEVVPNGGVRLSFGNEAVAEEISEAITA